MIFKFLNALRLEDLASAFNPAKKNLKTPIIIFQPGKVGSLSVLASLEKKYEELGLSTPVYHTHILENIDQRIEFLTRVRTDPTNTLNKLVESRELKRQMDDHPEKVWNIISLVRDPVALKISALFQVIDEYLPNWQKQFDAGEISLMDMQKNLFEKVEFHPDGLDKWFDSQLKPICKVDILDLPFAKDAGYQIYQPDPRINLMIIRLEDLNRVAAKAFREFIGIKKFSIISTNVSEEKPYHQLYEQFKKMPVSSAYLDAAYGTRYARCFYTEQEIESFRRRWSSQVLEMENSQ